ncbi:MAG: PD-(D/E)XK nuclease family protein, partial [Lentisphaeria bacterium]|nr:PD-(D/E)XK nuclease family protein [Lentisphaeria bacterium]
ALWQKQLKNSANGVLSECWNILKSIGESPDCPPTNRRESTAELAALESLISAAEHAGGKSADLICALFHQLCGTVQLRPVSCGEETLDAVGFLELPWYGDELVILAGFTENVLSGNRFSDPFLPEQAKKLLGVQTAEQSSAADAFRFAAMQNTAQLRFLVCRYGMRQDALKPPAILMRCPAKDLPQRIQDLFGERFVLPQQPENKRKLEPMKPIRKEPAQRRISVTDFSQYLRCPFTYYLQRVLGAENADGKAIELDNAQAGTLLHDVIAGCENAIKRGADKTEIFQTAEKQWAVFRHRFGEPPPGLLDLQFSIMKDNLRYFAEKQAAWYDQGWRLVRSEHDPETTTVPPCTWAEFYHKVFPESPREEWRENIEFKGRFDRLDAREIDGMRELCVIDYKTGAAKTPAEKHLCNAAGLTEDEKDFRAVPELNKYWADLQLPLYILMIRHLMPEEKADRIRAAYFNLPTAYASTGVYEFAELNEDLLRSAMRCADRVVRRIYGPRPVFWPPRKYDGLFEPYGPLTEDDFDANEFFLPPENAEEDMI